MPLIPKKTFALIRSINCHFLSQVKRNTAYLYDAIRLFTALTKPFATCQTLDTSAGRVEHRRIELFINDAPLPKGWPDIQRLIRVTRWGTRQGKYYEKISLYVTSNPINCPNKIAKMIRQHWHIENGLHWIKDVLLREDSITFNQQNSATNIGMLNSLFLNVLRMAGLKPNKDTFARFANKVNELIKLFQYNPIK